MSTFFKSAAMSILSRTLQALLYKYLSDVDVEGLALPSFSGSSDSGWGVRLCNVKLRDGTKLMDLPGNFRACSTKNTHKKKTHRKRQSSQQMRLDETQSLNQSYRTDSNQSIHTDYTEKRYKDNPSRQQPIPTQETPHTSMADTNTHFRNDRHTEASGKDPPLDSKSVRNSQIGKNGSEKNTNQSKRSNSWFKSWYSSVGDLDANENDRQGGDEKVNESQVEANEDIEIKRISKESNHSCQTKNSSTYPGRKNVQESCSVKLVPTTMSESKDSSRNGKISDISKEKTKVENIPNGSCHNVCDSSTSDDLEVSSEPPPPRMILRLGEGCQIGTLDVRLVGKIIHVLVEDAFLTVEVIRQQPESNDGAAASNNSTNRSADKISSNHLNPEPKTIGDRVLAENAIARVFSAIPNLFLRDILIRVIIRDDPVSMRATNESIPPSSFVSTEEPSTGYGTNESVIEFVIELLSVTDGDDFLSRFRSGLEEYDEDDSKNDGDYGSSQTDDSHGNVDRSGHSRHSSVTADNTNDFLTKRIRTGRGPEGGITLKIYPPCGECIPLNASCPPTANEMWARDSWLTESQFVVVRFSGLDLQTRIFLGTKQEIVVANTDWYGDQYYDYNDLTLDSMLFGGIVPGPQPPLPPISTPLAPIGNGIHDSAEFWGITAPNKKFTTDANGIQSCGIESSFHKVARGLIPTGCNEATLPCEYGTVKWKKAGGADVGHDLDKSIPLAGLVFHLSIRDPLEINIDRRNLETIGNLLSIFSKKKTEYSCDLDEDVESQAESNVNTNDMDDDDHFSEISISSSRRSGKIRSRHGAAFPEGIKNKERSATPNFMSFSTDTGFPSYMSPEKIQIIGIHLAELRFRVHCMKENRNLEGDFSFCFWSFVGKCLTFDYQQLMASERPFQDLRLDVGHLAISEYKGAGSKQIISIGITHNVIDCDEMTVETFRTREENQRSPWPSTAAFMLDIIPPLETLSYETRERHALQVRYTQVSDPGEEKRKERKCACVHVGPAAIDVPYAIRHDFVEILAQARISILGPPTLLKERVEFIRIDSLLKYNIRLYGGRVSLYPLVETCLPLTDLQGELSTNTGFSIETVLDRLFVKYGISSSNRALEQGLSLKQLAELPENVRLRILLFLKDLTPLEKALGIKAESDSFLQYRSVNKGILKMAKYVAKRQAFFTQPQHSSPEKEIVANSGDHACRRQKLMFELLRMDDNTLEALLKKHQRKLQKKSTRSFKL